MHAGSAGIEGDEVARLRGVPGLAAIGILCVDLLLFLLPAALAVLVLTGGIS